MANIPIALELYSVRNELVEDTAGTLKAVAEMGYVGVEFAGHPNNTAQELRTLLDDLGIVCCGWHTPIDLVQDDKLSETIGTVVLDNYEKIDDTRKSIVVLIIIL